MINSIDPELHRIFADTRPLEARGRVVWAFGGVVKVTGLPTRIGQICQLIEAGGEPLPAEVVGFSDGAAILAPLKPIRGLSLNAEAIAGDGVAEIDVGPALLSRVIDANGAPLDDRGPIERTTDRRLIYAEPPSPLCRRIIEEPFPTGVRVIDSLLTIGVGQRIGIFAAAGAGKTTLLGMIARHSQCDVRVIGLIGERGREVGEFIESALGPDDLAKTVVVVSTSDRAAMERVRAANLATAIAEGFAAQGANVVLMMDSVTRYARALREVGLGMGEAPVRRGFPPSVFIELPRLFERTGRFARGSITAFYTVLLEDEVELDPIGEEVRSILDGHVYLSRKLAEGGRYPAVDVAASVSRLFGRLGRGTQPKDAAQVRRWLAKFDEIEFLRQVGEYRPGGDLEADAAVARMPAVHDFLSQSPEATSDFQTCLRELHGLVS